MVFFSLTSSTEVPLIFELIREDTSNLKVSYSFNRSKPIREFPVKTKAFKMFRITQKLFTLNRKLNVK
jgi:hypothetical protein